MGPEPDVVDRVTTGTARPEGRRERWLAGHIPGEPGVWVLVLGDMTMFAVFFVLYATARGGAPSLFAQSQSTLSVPIGLLNTVLLLASSSFVARGAAAARAGEVIASRYFTLALVCGLAFGVDKAVEYGEKFSAGVSPLTNEFFMYYFVLTGVHALHVVIGCIVLSYLRRATRRDVGRPGPKIVEACASYWHLVDVLWILIFPLLYLL